MKALITGAAGFLGSHLSKTLLSMGYEVIGIDNFSDYYPRSHKEANLEPILKKKGFYFHEKDLLKIDNLLPLLEGVSFLFHLAAQAGVRSSWGHEFYQYTENNILLTQRFLEASKEASLKRFIFASSSSIYGNLDQETMKEEGPFEPLSPYGVSKMAAEQLCHLYFKNFSVPTISLRYFTVYGPGQRPDMAFNRFISAILKGKEVTIYGTGAQTRDFTFVDDTIKATTLAMEKGSLGEAYNIGGGTRISVNQVIENLEEMIGNKANKVYFPRQDGDPDHTCAQTIRAKEELGFIPQTDILSGLKKQVQWQMGLQAE